MWCWHARWDCSCNPQSTSLPPPRHLSSAMLLKKCSFHKLGDVERWAVRGSVPATMIRRIFNCLCARTAIDFCSAASEQSAVDQKRSIGTARMSYGNLEGIPTCSLPQFNDQRHLSKFEDKAHIDEGWELGRKDDT